MKLSLLSRGCRIDLNKHEQGSSQTHVAQQATCQHTCCHLLLTHLSHGRACKPVPEIGALQAGHECGSSQKLAEPLAPTWLTARFLCPCAVTNEGSPQQLPLGAVEACAHYHGERTAPSFG